MALPGGVLYSVIALLLAWLTFLLSRGWRLLKVPARGQKQGVRGRLGIAGIALSAVAVAALLLLHLTWMSPRVSQGLGVTTVRILALLLFWSTLAGFLLCVFGSGKTRFLGAGTSLVTGLWWFSLYMTAAISMGAPMARRPTRVLMPVGYVGWIEIKYGVANASALGGIDGVRICKVPQEGIVDTSSLVEDGWAKDEYLYYLPSGSTFALRNTGWGRGGMIWGETFEWKETPQADEYFFVGTEEQYRRAVASESARRRFNQSTNAVAAH